MMAPPRAQDGRLITLEGIEGAGKSSQIEPLASWLRGQGHHVVITREPGGTPVGDGIRAVLLERGEAVPHPDTELLLMCAARAEHVERVIRPALERGDWVISDRFTDASYAYQGAGRGIDDTRIAVLEEWVQGSLRPDRTILLDVEAATGLERARGRGQADRFEAESLAFFERVRARYLTRAEREPERFRVVDAHVDPDRVAERIRAAVADLAALDGR